MVEVVGTPELEGDHLLTAFGTAAVDVVFARLADFGDVKVRGDVRSVWKDEDDLLEVSEGLLEFLQVHGLVYFVFIALEGRFQPGKPTGRPFTQGFTVLPLRGRVV